MAKNVSVASAVPNCSPCNFKHLIRRKVIRKKKLRLTYLVYHVEYLGKDVCAFSRVYRCIIEGPSLLENAGFFEILIRIASFKNTLTFTFEHVFMKISVLEGTSDANRTVWADRCTKSRKKKC